MKPGAAFRILVPISSIALVTALLLYQTGRWNPMIPIENNAVARNITDTTPGADTVNQSSSQTRLPDDSQKQDSLDKDSTRRVYMFSSKSAPMPHDWLQKHNLSPIFEKAANRDSVFPPLKEKTAAGDSVLKKFRRSPDSSSTQRKPL